MFSSLDILPGRTQRWAAAAISLFLGIVVICVMPFSHRTMPVAPQFLTINLTVAVIFDLFVSLVLALQYRASGYKPIGVLMLGYSTTATLAISQVFGFPGILSERGMFSANSQTFVWLWIAWHAGFAVLVVVYALTRRTAHRDRAEPTNAMVWGIVGAGCALGCVIALIAFRCSLPVLIVKTVYTPSFRPIEALLILATLASIGTIVVLTRLRSVLDLWLTVALLGMLGETILTALGGARFSAGWYVARIFGQLTNCAVALTFFAELAVLYMRMSRLAYVDALTGLGNRRTFDQRLDEGVRNSVRECQPISLLMLDVDDFKKYNDFYGHIAGDDALRKVAASIGVCAARPLDTAARFGGEEFAVVLPNTDLDGAVDVAERIRAELAKQEIPHEASRAGPHLTVSIGVATARIDDVTIYKFIARADAALYEAKANGRNMVAIAPSAPNEAPPPTRTEELSA
jgi:diguanylate cyclase (GGDEF)-like protein